MAIRNIVCSGLLRLQVPKSNQLRFSRKFSAKKVMRHADELTVNKLLENTEKFDAKQWSIARNEILTTIKYINESNVDGIIINRCCLANKHKKALDYIDYLINERRENLNVVSIVKYFKLLHNVNKTLDVEHTKRVFQFYDEIRKKYDVLDHLATEGCILALSLTNRWKECLDLFEESKTRCNFGYNIYSAIIIAAFNNDEPEIAWSYLEQFRPDYILCKNIAEAYTNFCQRNFQHYDTLKIAMDKMFDFWGNIGIYPHVTTINVFMQFLQNTGNWDYTSTTIDERGICQHCRHSLPHFEIDDEHRNALLQYILNNVIVGKDVFRKTTPTELNRFLKFIEATQPYDVVVDGLNVAYGFIKYSERAKNVSITVDILSKRHKRILVLGKRHMLKWSLQQMKAIEKKSFLFLANNTSEDDLFTIYAALSGGSHTYFLTQDFLRDHKFILKDDKMKRMFRDWQLTRQLIPKYHAIRSADKIKMVYPPPYAVTPHKDEKGWHIPYTSTPEPFNPPDRWMCLRITEKVKNTESS